MCRRFRRIRRLAHQVVQVTRRLWRVCGCCGTVNEEFQRDIVPMTSVINGAVTKRSSANNPEVFPLGLCCFIPQGRYLMHENEGVHSCPSVQASVNKQSSRTDWNHSETRLATCDASKSGPGETVQDGINNGQVYASPTKGGINNGQVYASPTKDGINNGQVYASPTKGQQILPRSGKEYQNFKTDVNEGEINGSGKTSSMVSKRTLSAHSSNTGQTDDFVAMRLYKLLTPVHTNTTSEDKDATEQLIPRQEDSIPNQIDDQVSIRVYPKPSSLPRCSTSPENRNNRETNQTDDHVPMIFYGRDSPTPNPKLHGILHNKDQHHSTNQSHENSVSRPKRTVHFKPTVRRILYTPIPWSEYLQQPEEGPPINMNSQTVCFGRRRSGNLILEFAREQLWNFICPSKLPLEERLYSSPTSCVDLVTVGEKNREIAIKTMTMAESDLESTLLIECQCSRVVQLCACYVQGGMRYLCMQYYERRDLSVWLIKDRRKCYIREEAATLICAYVLAGLEFLHSKNILHLNVQPSNILIDGGGFPVLTDFGKAQRRLMRQPLESPGRLDDMRGLACVLYESVTRIVPPSEDNISSNLNLSMLTEAASNFVGFHLTCPRRERRKMKHRCDHVMGHNLFSMIDWNEVKNSSTCRLNKVERFRLLHHLYTHRKVKI
ncbi:cAMP-dependent protein kinase catalytic subunit-like [Liolophura sinensis]|uniref:cAMP-dependent protein kinase catalytic subunit-like n=1 Tax=Liolophura sinensis TaxID=3198878 RepID=UPI0031580E14